MTTMLTVLFNSLLREEAVPIEVRGGRSEPLERARFVPEERLGSAWLGSLQPGLNISRLCPSAERFRTRGDA
jgi:hypothetical protein